MSDLYRSRSAARRRGGVAGLRGVGQAASRSVGSAHPEHCRTANGSPELLRAAAAATRGHSSSSAASLTKTLESLSDAGAAPEISVAELVEALGEKAYGGLILVFALPNLAPLPPGASAILGIPLVFLAAQLALGMKPWFPEWILRLSVSRARLGKALLRLAPWIGRVELLLKPRWTWLLKDWSERAAGGICVMLAVVLALPVPLGNLPPAVALCLFAFGLLERDGVFVLAGIIAAAVAFAAAGGGLLLVWKAMQIFF